MKIQLLILIVLAAAILTNCQDSKIAHSPGGKLSPSEISAIEARLTEWQWIFMTGGDDPSSLAKLILPGDAERVQKKWMAYVESLDTHVQKELDEYLEREENVEYENLPAPDFLAMVYYDLYGIKYLKEESTENPGLESVNIEVTGSWIDTDESVIVRAIQTVDATAPLEPEVLLFSVIKEDDTWYIRVDDSLTNELIRIVEEIGHDLDMSESESEPEPLSVILGFGHGEPKESGISEIESKSSDQLAAAAESQSTVSLEAVVKNISNPSAKEDEWIWELESDGPKLNLHTTEGERLKFAASYGGDLNAVFRGSKIRVRGKVELIGDQFRIQLSAPGQITLLERAEVIDPIH